MQEEPMIMQITNIIVIWKIMYRTCHARNMILLIVIIIPLRWTDPSPLTTSCAWKENTLVLNLMDIWRLTLI